MKSIPVRKYAMTVWPIKILYSCSHVCCKYAAGRHPKTLILGELANKRQVFGETFPIVKLAPETETLCTPENALCLQRRKISSCKKFSNGHKRVVRNP
jgi:hypothetical protein